MNKFVSRKFIVAIVTVVVMVIAPFTGVEASEDVIANITAVAMTYLGAQGVVDGVEKYKEKKGND